MRCKYIVILLLMLYSACTLDRSNPLDPKANPNIKVPATVTNLELRSANYNVFAEWRRVDGVGSYYLYRCQTHNGVYERIAIIEQPENLWEPVEYHDQWNLLPGNWYFYRVSAVSEIPEGLREGLEGRMSDINYVIIAGD